MKMLFDRQSLAPADFKKIEAGYLAAKERYDLAREGARVEDKQAAAALLRQAEAQRGYEQKRVADTRLTAPISGVIARRLADPGKITAAGYPVYVILDLQRAKVRVGVPEAEIGKLRTGQTASVLVPSLENRAFPGVVEMVGYAADPVSRTFSVKIDVANPLLELRAGMVAEARIETGVRVRAITLPAEAIVRDPQGATQVYVYFSDQRRAHLRRVETGTLIEKAIEISKGLQGTEQIVIAGQQFLTDGAPVRVEGGAR
jgi:RND family efflux transporter MFP subunit